MIQNYNKTYDVEILYANLILHFENMLLVKLARRKANYCISVTKKGLHSFLYIRIKMKFRCAL